VDVNRRDFLQRTGAASLGASVAASLNGCARRSAVAAAGAQTAPVQTAASGTGSAWYDAMPALEPIRAHTDRLFRITVCLRPFRAQGPRIEAERVGDKLVVHNYGHGGSGWSLSWGSGALAIERAMAAGGDVAGREVAVIGCGALGLTSGTLLQRAGARVTIYAKERPPDVRSSRATGSWTPDSRIALSTDAPPSFAAQWEKMARTSWTMYQSYLGMPGTPVEFTDRYILSDDPIPMPPAPGRQQPSMPGELPRASQGPGPTKASGTTQTESGEEARIPFASYSSSIQNLTPRAIDMPPGSHPFPAAHVRRNSSLMFNIADYSRQLYSDFLVAGGRIETVEFHAPGELQALQQKLVFNCTGYGARRLWADESIVPVRGQIGWLIPQPGANYGLYFKNLSILGRRDGIVVQVSNQGENTGWKDENETPDREEAEGGVRDLAELYARMASSGKPPLAGGA
jgi:D-amino-acid oxidase